MFLHHLKISFRNLWKNPLYSLIHIIGLGIALTCVIIVSLFVKDEFSFDRFHSNSNRIYRLTTTTVDKEGASYTLGTSGQVQGPAFRSSIPEVQDFSRAMAVAFNVKGEKKNLRLDGLYVDPGFLKMFSFDLIHGSNSNALEGTNSIVLTEQSAMKFFGKTDVIGEVLKVEDGSYIEPFVVTGVTRDIPRNSSISFEILVPISFLQKSFKDDDWLNQYLTTYLLLQPGADHKKVSSKFSSIFQANAKEQIQKSRKSEGYSPVKVFGLQKLTDIHLNLSGLDKKRAGGDHGGISKASSLTYSLILTGIVVFILLMACINFVNLSVANSLRRAKEIGVRKITGSTRRQIISQFLMEAGLLCIASFALGVGLGELILPAFNSFVNKSLSIDQLLNPSLLLTSLLIVIMCIALAGLYPAFILARFNPTEVLYNKLRLSGRNWLGKSLVVFQFSLAICLILATLVYQSQMDFISQKDLGYNPSNIVRFSIPTQDSTMTVERMKSAFKAHPFVADVATGADNLEPVLGGFPTKINGNEVRYVMTEIDEKFIPMLNIGMVQGRNFSIDFADKKKSAIVNEAFVKAAGLTDPVGKKFENTWGGTEDLTIVGVVKDYHYGTLKQRIHPQVMIYTDDLNYYWMRIHPGQRAKAIELIQQTYLRYAPEHIAQYSFLEDDNTLLYRTEKTWQQIINYASVLSILICCIGLFGLAHLSAGQRTKEIGVRKVLGASTLSIVKLFSKDVVRLVFVAALIAFPVSWIAMNNWLQDFAYRIPLSPWLFVAAGLIAVLIAIATVSFQAIRSAIANPVKSLRTE